MSSYKEYGYQNADCSHVNAYILEPILNILAEKKGRKVLDAGCGNGWLTNILIEKGYDAYGTDASQEGVDIAKRKNPGRFFVQDLSTDDLPQSLQNIKFDTIISTEVIEHLYAPREYVRFCKKILTKSGGGELILTTPYHGYLKNVALSVTGNMEKHFTVLWDGGHIKFWSRDTLTKLLAEGGFRITKFVGCGRLPYLWKSMLLVAVL